LREDDFGEGWFEGRWFGKRSRGARPCGIVDPLVKYWEAGSLLCPRMRMVERGRNDAVRRCGTLLVLSAVVLVEVGFDRYWAV